MLRTLKELTSKDTRDGARFRMLQKIGRLIMPVYRFGWPQLLWWKDEEFNTYLSRFDELQGCNTDRRWMVRQLLKLITSVPGDTAECGVYKGATSYLICQAIKDAPRTHFIFDSFEGLSQPASEDGKHWMKGDLATPLERTKANLPFSNVSYHKGWIPDRFQDVADRRFAFVHIDVDLYQPTLDSVKFFYPRINRGGIMVCDDYGFLTCPGATKAFDEFQCGKPEQIVSAPCGGGFIIKV